MRGRLLLLGGANRPFWKLPPANPNGQNKARWGLDKELSRICGDKIDMDHAVMNVENMIQLI